MSSQTEKAIKRYGEKVEPSLTFRLELMSEDQARSGSTEPAVIPALVEVNENTWRGQRHIRRHGIELRGQYGPFVSVLTTERGLKRLALDPAVIEIGGGGASILSHATV